MNSRIAEELLLKNLPVAMTTSNEIPAGAIQFKQDARGCVVSLFTAASHGKIAVVDAQTTGCMGGQIGMGFCDQFQGPPGGIDYFLSTGRGEGYPEGECYKKTPELAKAFVDELPTTVLSEKYVIFSPLEAINADSNPPLLVSFVVNVDQLSALIVLANYDRATNDNAAVQFAAGCHSIFLLPLAESKMQIPKAIIGLTDVTARPFVDADKLSFTVPWSMFQEMENNIEGSFLEKHDWKKVRERIAKG
jgi:uncharacterized protein (DUF169 family)